jgi:SMC interacting uncharacterized protein involved in chromosome segregation
MDLLALLNNLVATINELNTKLVDAQAAADQLAQVKFQEGADSKNAEIEALKAEIEALKAGGAEKKFSQSEVDAFVLEATAPLQVKVDELGLKVNELDQKLAEFDAQKAVEIEAAVSGAKVSLKAELLAKYKEAQAKESEVESIFELDLN